MLEILFFLLYLAYCILLEGVFYRTIGKFITGTIVLSTKTYEKPSFGQIFRRSFSRLIPFEALSFISEKPWGWHDSISDTMVTTTKSSLINKQRITELSNAYLNFFKSKILKLLSINKGIFRLIITLSILIPLIISIIAANIARYSDGETFFEVLFFTVFSYWAFVFVGLWIYEGFEENK